MIERVVLLGLSGSGKSTTAAMVADALGWEAIDLDATIEQQSGRTIPEIFRSEGEAGFRAIEARVFREALSRNHVVIATGGGAVLDPTVWAADLLGHDNVLTVWLDAETGTLVERLLRQAEREGSSATRPLLEGDPVANIAAMRTNRQAVYRQAKVALDVTHRSAPSVAADIAEMVTLASGRPTGIPLQVEHATSRLQVGSGSSAMLGSIVRHRWPSAQRVFVVVDAGAAPHVESVVFSLTGEFGSRVHTQIVPSGESSKSVDGLSALYDAMLGDGIERGDVVVALGGGVVGDLAGFAAATVLRGVGLVQVPTTLLAMVDSSVGGKTAINHAAGKNLIGAFYQPAEVVIDPNLLASLPPRECRSGWAEIIKHAVIEPSTPGGQPPVLLDVLERNQSALSALQEPLLSLVIRQNVALKAAVVAADEREAGIRAYLNFGHTIGHGIEAAGYSLLHGEAIALGMSAALSVAEEMDLVDVDLAMRVRSLISAYGLPLHAPIDADAVLQKMASDKKKAAGKQKWVLPCRTGGVEVRTDVSPEVIRRAIEYVTAP